jgi:hypothetical protein
MCIGMNEHHDNLISTSARRRLIEVCIEVTCGLTGQGSMLRHSTLIAWDYILLM